METFALLNTRFLESLEAGNENRIKEDYEEIRSKIVCFSHDTECWRTVHTGLTLLVTELEYLLEEGLPGNLPGYARRILTLARHMISQVELIVSHSTAAAETVNIGNTEEVSKEEPHQSKTPEIAPLTLTANYSDLAEIINVIITMKMANGGRVKNNVIIEAVHNMFGLDCGTDRYYNTRNAIRYRCPKEGTSLTYFLDAARDAVNTELSER